MYPRITLIASTALTAVIALPVGLMWGSTLPPAPEACLTALDASEELAERHSDVLQTTNPLFEAFVESMELRGTLDSDIVFDQMETTTAELSELRPQMSDALDAYTAAATDCRDE